ncbi:MAG: dUTP diphosphatase [Proteobacteria bacterium]|nr:dUTP diphosphatase [Pseudomonadota bacterium]
MVNLNLKILDPRLGRDFALPSYGTSGSAGLDLRACLKQACCIEPGSTQMIPTGVAIDLRDNRYMAMLAPRSGLGIKKRIILANSVGIIDSDYQNEIQVALWNAGTEAYTVEPGERICQMIIVAVQQVSLNPVEEFASKSERGLGGLGHTGRF